MGYLDTAKAIWGAQAKTPDVPGASDLTPPGKSGRSGLTPAPAPRPDRLRGPRRTPWGTWVWSDPAEPPIEWFGEPPS
jgi:hypothetical protein